MPRTFRFLLCILALCACQWMRLAPSAAEDFVSGYYTDQRLLLLGESMEEPEGKLKPFERMSPREIATIYHELWHAYFLECETPSSARPNGGDLYRAFRGEIDRLYPTHPPEKRMEIHEEAVADFIDAAVETYVQMKRFLASKTPRRRETIRKTSAYLNSYRQVFQDHYTGYYTTRVSTAPASVDTATSVSSSDHGTSVSSRNRVSGAAVAPQRPFLKAKATLSRFIRDAKKFGLPVGYLRSASARIRGVVFIRIESAAQPPEADVVWAAAPLPAEDMERVQRILFEGVLSPDPLVVFAEDRFASH